MTVDFEDTFELNDLSKWDAPPITVNGTVAIATARPHTGLYHVRCIINNISSQKRVALSKTFATALTRRFIRGYFFYSVGPTLATERFTLMAVYPEIGITANYFATVTLIGGGKILVNYRDAGAFKSFDTGIVLSPDQYNMIEIGVTIGSGTGSIEVYVNGQQVANLTNLSNYEAAWGNIKSVRVGAPFVDASVVGQTVDIDDIAMGDAYIGPPQGTFSLVVTSNPVTGVPITVDGSPYNTPTSPLTLQPGPHTIIAPSNVTVNASIYNFVSWENGSTNPVRDIDLIDNVTLTCTYQLASTTKTAIEIHAFGVGIQEMNVQYEIVGIKQGTTPDTVEVPAGTYTVKVTYQGMELTQQVQVSEGQTMRVDFQFGPPVFFPQLFPWLRSILHQVLTRLRTIRDSRR